MLKRIARQTTLWISIIALTYSYGCILSPQEDPAPPDNNETAEFMDLTEREHVITNLVLSYSERNISEFSKLLLKVDDTYNGSTYGDGYYWYNQEGAEGLEVYILRDVEINLTGNMFLAALETPAKEDHQVLDDLTLDIDPGSWMSVTEIFDEPCEDCWFTERPYELEITYGENKKLAYHNVQFYIVPVDEGDLTIYKIAIAKDIPKSVSP